MAFVDEVIIYAKAGDGGNGVIRWLRNKETAMGGPAGGDGGKGGDIIIKGIRDLGALAQYQFEKSFAAEAGHAGENFGRHGANGASRVLQVPVGTLITVRSNGNEFEITEEGQEVVPFKGGMGGRGNINFKSSTNQNPFQQTDGKKADGGELKLTLKLIAEAGFIGLPNAGKSSLLNELTRSKSKVGAYPFTTLDPHLGDFYGHILADIPGLIEGASEGRGLGSKFLKHVERTRMLVHLVSAELEDPIESYRAVRKELEAFGRGLAEKRELVVLSKTDLLEPGDVKKLLKSLEKTAGGKVTSVSVIDETSLKAFSDLLASELADEKKVAAAE